MCGILAGSGKLNPQIIAALGCLNAKRGDDSAGVAWSDGDPAAIRVSKLAKHPATAFSIHLAEDICRAALSGVVIGHTRAATTGGVTDANAHPFLMDGIVFAHNGIISNYAQFGQYAVDSQSLIHGIKKRDFSEYDGSVALVWIEGNKLFAYRKGNPLFRGLKDGALYLASEASFLAEVGCRKVRELAESHIYAIAGGGIVKSQKVPGNRVVVGLSAYTRYDNYDSWEGGNWKAPLNSRRAKEEQKPVDMALCVCGHAGKAHTHATYATGKWMCYEKIEHGRTCPCSAFVEKAKVSLKPKLISCAICKCGHAITEHLARGSANVCHLTDCPCMCFVPMEPVHLEPANTVIDSDKLDIETWKDVPPETICECTHELEYHQGPGHQCYVQACGCSSFWPESLFHKQDDTPDPGKEEEGKAGWHETWRVPVVTQDRALQLGGS